MSSISEKSAVSQKVIDPGAIIQLTSKYLSTKTRFSFSLNCVPIFGSSFNNAIVAFGLNGLMVRRCIALSYSFVLSDGEYCAILLLNENKINISVKNT